MEQSGEIMSITTSANDCAKVRNALKERGINVKEAGLKYIAKQDVPISDETTAAKLLAFKEAIEEDDDVSEIHTNANIDDAIV